MTETEETVEQKLARYENVIGLQMQEIDRLRAVVAKLTEGTDDAHSTLRRLYLDETQSSNTRVRAAQAALNVEKPKLQSVQPPLTLVAEEYEDLATLVTRQRKRCDELQREMRDIEVSPSGTARVLPKPGSNGSGDDHS